MTLTLTFIFGDLVTLEMRKHVRHVLASIRPAIREKVCAVNYEAYRNWANEEMLENVMEIPAWLDKLEANAFSANYFIV